MNRSCRSRDFLTEENIKEFINFGEVVLKPVQGVSLYASAYSDLTLEECAAYCLNETSFFCASFDFTHDVSLSETSCLPTDVLKNSKNH